MSKLFVVPAQDITIMKIHVVRAERAAACLVCRAYLAETAVGEGGSIESEWTAASSLAGASAVAGS